MRYKGVIELVEGYNPPLPCHEHMLKDLPPVLVGVTNMPKIVREAIRIAQSCLQHIRPNSTKLSHDKAIAIAAYSYDLGFNTTNDGKDNFYYVFNAILRERSPAKMIRLKPYIYYLMAGLSELPPISGVVYRGVPNTSMEIIKQNYLLGNDIHWSAFTSTTTDIVQAKQFAMLQGDGGILFRITILTGRRIKVKVVGKLLTFNLFIYYFFLTGLQ